ncbi:MAG: HAD family hydrolase [Treponema sp.]|nr:HAD family hydrolase [Treponema sp.]
MKISNSGEIKAVAFDIDGTLYRNRKLNIRVLPYVIRHLKVYTNYNKVRKELRQADFYGDLYDQQNRLMAQKLNISVEEAEVLVKKICYDGISGFFKKFKAEKGTLELFARLKENGIKIAVLSDFPPEQKGDMWGMMKYCDVVLGSEEIGALKPSQKVFQELINKLDLPPEQILYVGNSHRYDVEGSKKAGMKAAWVIAPSKRFFGKKSELADFTFVRFSELENFIFGDK